VGGSFNDFSGNNSFGFALEVLPDDLDLALDLFEQAMVYPAFKPATVAREREAQAAEIAEENDDIVTATRRQLREKFFGAHPLASESAGTLESVARLDVATMKALHRSLVVAGNTVVAVSGDFRRADLLPKLRRILAKLPGGAAPQVDTSFAGPAQTGEVLVPMDRQQVIVMQAYTGTGLLDADFYVGEVTDELFSGMSSNLFERVREEKSLAYFVRSARVIGLQTGMFFFMAGTSTQGYPQVVKEFTAEIKRVSAGRFLEGEVERCRTRLKAARRMSMQSNASCAAQAALNALYGLPVNDWRNYDAHIDAVTAADVARFAKTRFVASQQVRLLAGALKP
jgi:zinc protease